MLSKKKSFFEFSLHCLFCCFFFYLFFFLRNLTVSTKKNAAENPIFLFLLAKFWQALSWSNKSHSPGIKSSGAGTTNENKLAFPATFSLKPCPAGRKPHPRTGRENSAPSFAEGQWQDREGDTGQPSMGTGKCCLEPPKPGNFPRNERVWGVGCGGICRDINRDRTTGRCLWLLGQFCQTSVGHTEVDKAQIPW